MIDLHAHTMASDGTDSPRELISAAVAAGVTTLAITDHDSTAGWAEAIAAVQALDVNFTLIPGAEFSCRHDRGGEAKPVSVHLLGYLFDPQHSALRQERARLRESRLGRGEAIVAKLTEAGFPISWSQVQRLAGAGAVGRPHIGQALVESGVVSDVSTAFADLLSSSSPHYVEKQDMPLIEGISLIRQAGGVPVIAHPWARRRGVVLSEQELVDLVDAGLLGIEADHPDHSPQDRARLHELAAELGVFATGSSDYHGTNKRTPIAAETTAADVAQRLVQSASGSEPIVHTFGMKSSRIR